MALFESLAGNSLVALAIIGILPTVYIGSIVAALLLKEQGAFILRISGMAVALIFAVILLMFGSGIGKVMAIVVLMLGVVDLAGYFNVFKTKLDLCLVRKIDPNICNFTCFTAIVLFLLMFVPETAVGVIVGLIILVVLVVILAVVLIPLLGGELAAVGGRSAVGRAAPELMGTEREGEMAMRAMRQTAGVSGEAAGAEKSGVRMLDEAAQSKFKAALENLQVKRTGIMGDVESLQKELKAAEEIKNEKLSKSLRGQISEKLEELERLKSPEAPEGKGGFGRFGRIHGSDATSSLGGNMWLIVLFLAIIGLVVLFALPSTSQAGQARDQFVNFFVLDLVQIVAGWITTVFETILAWFINTFVPCETGNTGVICQTLKYKSCEPFCISQVQSEPAWKGFEITQLAVVPSIIFDYQKFSILAEFVNNGEGEAKFKAGDKELQPTFGYYVGGDPLCLWNPFEFIVEPNNADRCLKLVPISQKQPKATTIYSGDCAYTENVGGKDISKLRQPCPLEPTDSTQVRWVGFEVTSNVIPKGKTIRSDITITVPYVFVVPNDLVGTLTVQSLNEQITADTTLKKEGQIIKKINKAYSPPGPLMMAMGTAERQVVSGVPSLFIIQFANKGKGIVDYGDGTSVRAENVRIYLPKEFEVYNEDLELCDFKKWKSVSQLTPAENKTWNPGPGFGSHVIYEINRDIPAIIQTRTALETPTLYCVLKTPTVTNIETFDFKARVLEYGYVESKRTTISITGTSIDTSGGGSGGGGSGSNGTIKKSMPICELKDDFGLCDDHQTLDLGGTYKIKKIIAKAKHGGSICTGDPISFNLLTSNKKFVGNIGVVPNVASQQEGTVTKEFITPVSGRYVEASVAGFCPYIDTLFAEVTYVS